MLATVRPRVTGPGDRITENSPTIPSSTTILTYPDRDRCSRLTERDGIQIALRAHERFEGTLPVTLRGNKGRYEAALGITGSPEDNLGTWNYDWHVDLRDSGTTLADYELTLIQTFSPIVFDQVNPIDLTFEGLVPGNAVLYQSSQNPGFGNDIFDPDRRGTYNLKLTLKPKRGGKPLSVQIQVTAR